MSTVVKHFHSGMPGAPTLGNNWGDLVAVLDACLVNGYGLRAVTSLTVAANVATVTVSAGHSLQVDMVAMVEGATPAALNGEKRVLSTTANTFTFAAPGVANQTATGTISTKVASLDWEKPFSGTHKGAYRSKNLLSPKNMLLVHNHLKTPGYDTTWAKWANVGIVQGLSDIDTIVGAQAPFNPTVPTQNWAQTQANQWGRFKWYHAKFSGTGADTNGDSGVGNRRWVLIGDDRLFFLFTAVGVSGAGLQFNCYCFGDAFSFRPADNFSTLLCADENLLSTTEFHMGGTNGDGLVQALNFGGKVLLRNHTQLGNPVPFGVGSLKTNNAIQQWCGSGDIPFPHGPDGSLLLFPTYVQQNDNNLRGIMPGMLWLVQDRPYSHLTVVDNVASQPGKRFLLVRTTRSSTFEGAQIAFDISGPWR